eukprot:Awhi_evm3s14730
MIFMLCLIISVFLTSCNASLNLVDVYIIKKSNEGVGMHAISTVLLSTKGLVGLDSPTYKVDSKASVLNNPCDNGDNTSSNEDSNYDGQWSQRSVFAVAGNRPCSLSDIADKSYNRGALAVFIGFQKEGYQQLQPFATYNKIIMTIAILEEDLMKIISLIENDPDISIIIEKVAETTNNNKKVLSREMEILIISIGSLTLACGCLTLIVTGVWYVRSRADSTSIDSVTAQEEKDGRLERKKALSTMNMSIITVYNYNDPSFSSSTCTSTDEQVQRSIAGGQLIEECCICLQTVVPGDKLRRLPCEHLFHKNCIDKWLIDKGTCVVCRKGFLSIAEDAIDPSHINEGDENIVNVLIAETPSDETVEVDIPDLGEAIYITVEVVIAE